VAAVTRDSSNVAQLRPAPEQAPEPEFKGRTLEAYKRMFTRAEEACSKARKLAHRDRDWFDNFDDSQWSDKEKKILGHRGQPPSTSNRLRKKVRFLRGLEQRQRSDPKAYPRKPNDEKSASVITDVLDFVEQQTRFDHTASESFKDLAVEGIEACEVIVENGETVVNALQYDGFFYDPRSKKTDFSDARYLGYQDWFDDDEAIEMAMAMGLDEAKAKEAVANSHEGDEVSDEGYEDKPWDMWGDPGRKRVRICCMYWKDGRGVWNYVYFTGSSILKEGVSVYLDDKKTDEWPNGTPSCAIIAASVYLTRKNERYGALRDDISPQSEINFTKTNTVFNMKNRRMWAKRPGILPANASEIVAKADGVLIANGEYGTDWGFIDSQAEIANNFNFLQEAKLEIDGHGPNAGLVGRGVEDQSGKAIALQQNAGMAEENDIFDIHNDWKLRVYRAMWFRTKQFKTAEWYVRVTEDNEAPRFVGLNTPKPRTQIDPATGQPVLDEKGQPVPMVGPDGKPVPEIDPATGQPIIENNVAEMDADIILTLAPDSITLQHEEFQELAELAKSGIPIPPDVLILASQIRDKQKLVERMKEEGGAQAKLQQAAQQIEQMQQALQAMTKQLQQAREEAQQAALQKPLTPVDMVKMQTEQVKQGHITAQTDHTRAQTAQIVKETMTPPEGPEPFNPLDAAKVRLTDAQAENTQVNTAKVIHDINNPPPPPRAPGNGAAR
jgi:hypothetical protein